MPPLSTHTPGCLADFIVFLKGKCLVSIPKGRPSGREGSLSPSLAGPKQEAMGSKKRHKGKGVSRGPKLRSLLHIPPSLEMGSGPGCLELRIKELRGRLSLDTQWPGQPAQACGCKAQCKQGGGGWKGSCWWAKPLI